MCAKIKRKIYYVLKQSIILLCLKLRNNLNGGMGHNRHLPKTYKNLWLKLKDIRLC